MVYTADTGDIRLQGGQDTEQFTSGRVEVYVDNGNWRAVCSEGWDEVDAMVACREILGYPVQGKVKLACI